MSLRYAQALPHELDAYARDAATLEGAFTYPLGEDRFALDHGKDYFAFHRRLGAAHGRFAYDGDRLVGMACAVLRTLLSTETWYICDLKVHPDFQSQTVALRLLTAAIPEMHARCPRAYAVTMNPPRGTNPMVRLMQKWFGAGAVGAVLQLSTLTAEQAQCFPSLKWLSLGGVKDVVLQSTGKPMNLLHATTDEGGPPVEGAVHMVCAAENSAFAKQLNSLSPRPAGSATVLHHGLRDWDWSFIRSSDI